MISYLPTIISIAADSIGAFKTQQEEWKLHLRKRWEESKNLPRKKKKRERKDILFDWSLANWDPFNIGE